MRREGERLHGIVKRKPGKYVEWLGQMLWKPKEEAVAEMRSQGRK